MYLETTRGHISISSLKRRGDKRDSRTSESRWLIMSLVVVVVVVVIVVIVIVVVVVVVIVILYL